MDPDPFLMNAAVIGALVMFISFIIYILCPSFVFIVVFGIGLILLVSGYSYLHKGVKDTATELERKREAFERDGFIISLDGTYEPENDDAIIETLM